MSLSPELNAEILDCLRRSGYLLESGIVRSLSQADFFVEPNIAVLDPRTGKSREIDLCVEFFDYEFAHDQISVKTRFAIEAVNNNLPLVLMTPHPDPRTEDFEGYLRYGTTPDPCPFLEAVELHDHKVDLNSVHYAQYCGLSRKKADDALMASHPDDLYSSLLKLAEFVEEEFDGFTNRIWHPTDSYWRLWFWKGVLVVAGNLLVVSEAHDGSLSLAEVDEGRLIFNFHSSDQPRSALIQVVREGRLLAYLKESVAEDREIALKLRAARSRGTRPR